MTENAKSHTESCAHGVYCQFHPDALGANDQERDRLHAELAALRAQVAYYEGPQKQPGRITLVPAEQRAPLYAAYKAAREWADRNGESYSDDGIIQAAVKAYRAELVTQAKQASGVSA
ncbi:hypothetical protein AB0B63_18555 [Micromonospora sp. NPDC049081]|uniref:hypothetical protein n=1 Tax=Micromonospora sp. NPDC049081 TaxID=3155150 RepID=UPI0033DB2D78